MIANEQELSEVKAQIAELNERLQAVFKSQNLSHFEAHVTATGYDKMIAKLQREIDSYAANRSQTLEDVA